jgi:uncharacterized protein (DUF433 family)
MPEHDDSRPHITVDPAVCDGEPCIGGTRIPAETIAQMVWAGYTLDDLQREYPTLTYGQIVIACWYSARHGKPAWQRYWRNWRIVNFICWNDPELIEKAPLPPSSKEAANV